MIVQIPSKFIQQNIGYEEQLKTIYINTDHIMLFEVDRIMNYTVIDDVKEYYVEYSANILLNNNYTVPLKWDMDEQLFYEFIEWANKKLAFANLKEYLKE